MERMENRGKFYACFRKFNGEVKKVAFDDRDSARDFISINYDPKVHEQVWTE